MVRPSVCAALGAGGASRAMVYQGFGLSWSAGKPQTGQGHNEGLLPRFGVTRLKGTPAMFAVAPDGRQLNSRKDALDWRNADSRGEAGVFDWLSKLAPPPPR